MSWNFRAEAANYDGLETYDSIGAAPGVYSALADWPSSCNVVNWGVVAALKSNGARPAFVQKKENASPFVGGTFTTWSTSFDTAVTIGNSVVVAICFNTAVAISGVYMSDNLGNHYWPVFGAHAIGSADFVAIFVAPVTSGGSLTVTANQVVGQDSMQAVAMAIHEYSGIDTTPMGVAGGTGISNGISGIVTSGANSFFPWMERCTITFAGVDYQCSYISDTQMGCTPSPPATTGAWAITKSPLDFAGYTYTLGPSDAVSGNGSAHVNSFSTTVTTSSSNDLLFFVTATLPFCAVPSVGGGGAIGCSPAWLTINEPTSLSPIVLGGFVDQTRYLRESASFASMALQRGTATIPMVIPAGNSYEPTVGAQVCLWDITDTDEFEVFSGTIDDWEISWQGDDGTRYITLTCVSLEQVFDTIRVPAQLFTNKTCGYIFSQLFGLAAGSPIGAGTIDAGPTLDSFLISGFPTIADLFKQLATLAGFIWGVDPSTGLIYFTLPSTVPAAWNVLNEEVLWESFTFREERHDYRNRQILKLSQNIFTHSSELFTGGGQTSFTLLRPVQEVTNAWITKNTQNVATASLGGNPSPGDTVSFAYPVAGSNYNWTANFAYSVGNVIIDPSGFLQKVTAASGNSGSVMPTWNELTGGTTTDNLLVWTCQGPAGLNSGQIATYTFAADLTAYIGGLPPNTLFGIVLIGASASATMQNLADAINRFDPSTPVAGRGAGVNYSLPTWENPLVNADAPSGASMVVRNKAAGRGYIAALTKTGSAFSWSAAFTSGGVTTFGTSSVPVAVQGQSTTGLVYTPGSATVTMATALNAGTNLQIEYTRQDGDTITVEDTLQVTQRAEIENSTGKYQQSVSDSQNLTNPSQGLAEAQSILFAYDQIPQTFEFQTYKPGLLVGQLLTIAMTKPAGIASVIPAQLFIQEIRAEIVPAIPNMSALGYGKPGYGHYRYTVKCIDVAQIGSWIAFWQGLIGGGGGGGSAASPYPGGGAQPAAQTVLGVNGTQFPAVNVSDSTPAAPSGKQNIKWQTDAASPTDASAYMPPMVGATASPAAAGTGGAVPQPASGDALKFLRGDGTFAPAGGILLETNSTPNGSQSQLNLVAGSGVTLTDDGIGDVTIAASGGGSGALTRIAQQILGSPASLVTFSSISAAYTNLVLTIVARSTTGSNGTSVSIQFNGDTGNNYSWNQILMLGGSSFFNGQNVSGPSILVGNIPTSGDNAGSAGQIRVMINGYSATAFNKAMSSLNFAVIGALATRMSDVQVGGEWANTAAVNAIAIFPGGGNFATGSVFTLYGES